jgi:predicted lipoprotein with Yx(FWY)xxD motif
MKRFVIPAAALAAVLALAACGGSSSNSGSTTPSAANHTVAVKSVDGVGNVLVDANGMPLYSSSLDTSGKPGCDGACAAIWKPLTVASGTPSADEGAGKVGVVMRSDGTRQVAIAGRPLYTFVKDSPGKVTGNGVSDAFSGRRFTWAAVLAGGKSAPAGAKSGSTSGAGAGYGGGGY